MLKQLSLAVMAVVLLWVRATREEDSMPSATMVDVSPADASAILRFKRDIFSQIPAETLRGRLRRNLNEVIGTLGRFAYGYLQPALHEFPYQLWAPETGENVPVGGKHPVMKREIGLWRRVRGGGSTSQTKERAYNYNSAAVGYGGHSECCCEKDNGNSLLPFGLGLLAGLAAGMLCKKENHHRRIVLINGTAVVLGGGFRSNDRGWDEDGPAQGFENFGADNTEYWTRKEKLADFKTALTAIYKQAKTHPECTKRWICQALRDTEFKPDPTWEGTFYPTLVNQTVVEMAREVGVAETKIADIPVKEILDITGGGYDCSKLSPKCLKDLEF